MQQTKLIQLLRTFSSKELKKFDGFLVSPYFNASERVVKFFRLLAAYQPAFDSNKLDKEKVYSRLYGKGNYNDVTMRELSSVLFQLAKQFIAYENFACNDLEISRQRYLWLSKKNAFKMVAQELDHAEKLLEFAAVNDNHYYEHKWIAEYQKFDYNSQAYRDLEHKLLDIAARHEHIHALNRYYLVMLFESYIYILNVSYIYNRQFDYSAFEYMLVLAQQYLNTGDSVIDIYYNMLQLLKTRNEQYFFELKRKFLMNDPLVSVTLKTTVAVNLENYCMTKLRENNSRFVAELMDIYRFDIKHGFMFEQGTMPNLFYRNVILTGIDAREIDFVEGFMEEYKMHLPEEFREDIYNFCRAAIIFEQGKFNEALKIALTVNPFWYFGRLEIKALLSRIHYELGMFDELEVTLDSYKYTLSENKLAADRKEGIASFVATLKQLIKLRNKPVSTEITKLAGQIETATRLSYKYWLTQKLLALKASKGKRA